MRDINIQIHDNHTVDFENGYAGLNLENLQGNITFNFDNFVDGQARVEIIINNQDGYILVDKIGQTYTLPIKSSLLTGDSVLMQLVIEETNKTTYNLTTDTEINTNKTYYIKVGNSFEVVEQPVKAELSTYYEADTPIWKSEIFYLNVGTSINATTTIPEDYPSWVETINNLITQTENAIDRAGNVNITATQTEDGAEITTTNQDGEQTTVEIKNGEQGQQGETGPQGPEGPAGKDGYVQYTAGTNIEINDNTISAPLTDYVKNTDYATASTGGVVKINSSYGSYVSSSGLLYTTNDSYATYQNRSDNAFIGKGTLENVITGKGLVSNTIIKTTTNTTAGNVYDVTYINSQLGDIATALNTINGENI